MIVIWFPRISPEAFIQLMQGATKSVQFSFDDVMYQQVDGLAMGSPLGPALANVFVEFYRRKLFEKISRPLYYCRYVDDTLAIFQNASECSLFLTELNSLHPSHSFTCEKEHDNQLPFLDILIEKTKTNLLRRFIENLRLPRNTRAGIFWL